MPDRPRHLERTRQTRGAARDHQGRPQCLARREAGIPCGRGRQAADLLCETGPGAKQEYPHGADAEQREEHADADPRAFEQARDTRHRVEVLGLRKIEPLRILPGPAHQITQHLHRNIHQHQADQDLVGVEPVPQHRRDGRPQHAPQDPRENHRHHDPCAGCLVGQQRHTAGKDRAQDVLPLGADVPDIGAKTYRQPEGDDQQRRGLDQQFAHRVPAFDRLPEKHLEAAQRVFPQGDKQDDPDHDRDQQRQQWRAVAPEIRGLRAGFELKHVRSPTIRSSIHRSSRSWPRQSAPTATAGPWRSRATGR